MKIRFSLWYFIITIVLLIIEILIALYVRDAFIRPYFGDVLVVMLIYYFLRSFFPVKVLPGAIGVLAFAFLVEVLQYFQLVKILGLEHSVFFRIILGTSFAWEDMICYVAGFALILLFERKHL